MRVTLGRYRSLLGAYLLPQRRQIALLFGLLLVGLAFELFNPLLLRDFIDRALEGAASGVLARIALVFLGVAVATQLAGLVEAGVAENVGLRATNNLRGDLALHCLQLDPSFHNSRTPGELIERIDGDVATLGNFFSRFVVQMIGNALLLLAVLVLLWRIDWRIGAALTMFVVVSMAALVALRNVSLPAWTRAREASARLYGFLEERLAATEDLRASGAVGYTLHQLDLNAREVLVRQARAFLSSSLANNATVILFTAGTATALAVGALLYGAGAITLGTVFMVFTYTELLRRPIEQITRQMQDLQQAGASLNRVIELLDMRSNIQDSGTRSLPSGALDVRFEQVKFGYHHGAPVLDGVSLHVPAGTRLGLLGRTGSGKTTLSRLLFRLYDVDGGAVLLDGIDTRAVPLAELRSHVSLVTQEIQLFHATVRDNLTMFDPNVPDARVVDALEQLGLDGWLNTLPQGLDSVLAPGGGVSAGEAQLLAFARAFLRDPAVVVLDEASSRLDPATERRLERAIDRLLEGRTGIVIAHRLASAQRADAIAILDHGRVVEYGAPARLAADPGSRFAELLATGAEVIG